ncbi:hypothetical protein D3C85_1757780 [compost metagenome]
MHRATLAIARAALLAVDLLHHRHRIDALGNAMAVAAVCAGDAVAIVQVVQNADARGFLARV